MSHKKKTYEAKRKQREENKPIKKEHGNVRDIAEAIIVNIQEDWINYRQFKMIVAIVDEKFDKPSWVPKKEFKT